MEERRRLNMKSESTLEIRRKGQPAGEDQPGTGPSPASESDDTPPRQDTQAERGVMHPDRDDMEWRYWRGGWGRLTE
jgi:hypothetical protein